MSVAIQHPWFSNLTSISIGSADVGLKMAVVAASNCLAHYLTAGRGQMFICNRFIWDAACLADVIVAYFGISAYARVWRSVRAFA
jgi:hypothetical protein